jgi:nucleotide-binding universal stress UspA family protein
MSIVATALDNTPAARAVLETAIQFGRLSGTVVEAVHVRRGPPGQLGALELLTARHDVPLRIVEGPVECALCDALGAPEVLAAVIGARSMAGGRRPVGRTALHVLGHIDKPVLVVPPDAVAPGAFHRLLVPLEGIEALSSSALEQLSALLAAEVELIVLHVFTEDTMPLMLDRPGRDLEILGREFLTRHCPPAARIELRPGPVAMRVAEVSKEHGADLIVLIWSRDTSIGRAATVREVLGASALPVLLLPVAP